MKALAGALATSPERVTDLATVPFGATLGLGVGEAFEAMTDGLRGVEGLKSITYCEPHRDRFGQLEGAVAKVGGREALVVLPADSPTPDGTAPIEVSITRANDTITMRIQAPIDDVAPTVQAASCNLSPERIEYLKRVVEGSDSGPPDDLVDVGGELAAWFPKLEAALRGWRDRCLDLIMDDPSSVIPWEALRYPDGSSKDFVPAMAGGVRRRLIVDSVERQPVRRIGPGQPLSVLLVLDPTENLPQGEKEAIRAALERQPLITVTRCEGRQVTTARLLDLVTQGHWDVLHYAGHSKFAPDVPKESGLKTWDGWLTADKITREQCWPPLVVVNSCRSAAMASVKGSGEVSGIAPSLVRDILCAGVRTFIGTLWRVNNRVCELFSRTLYDRMVLGETVGEAVRAARIKLQRDQANYVTYGDVDLRF